MIDTASLASSARMRGRLYVQWRAALAGRIDITDNILIAASLPPGHSNTRSANCPPGQPPRPKISFLQKSIASSSCVLSCFRIRCWRRGQAGYRGRRGRSEHTEHWEREIIHWINLNKVLLNYMPNVHSALPQQGGIYNWPGLHLLIEKIEVVLKSSSSGCQNGYTYFCPSNFNYFKILDVWQ